MTFLDCPPAQSFFIPASGGPRFCIYHAPHPSVQCQGTILYVPPFAEEMNRTRRIAALQARAFAAHGYAVLQPDLFGCGDSDGELRDATWEIWKDDLAIALAWLTQRSSAPVSLWGVRLGALLALDFAAVCPIRFKSHILWQPILSGQAFLTQFLRLHVATEMFTASKEKKGGVTSLRGLLSEGQTLEIAGYDITPIMARTIDELDGMRLIAPNVAIHWMEITPINTPIAVARQTAVQACVEAGAKVHLHQVHCPPFWSTQEIAECPELLAVTTHALRNNTQ